MDLPVGVRWAIVLALVIPLAAISLAPAQEVEPPPEEPPPNAFDEALDSAAVALRAEKFTEALDFATKAEALVGDDAARRRAVHFLTARVHGAWAASVDAAHADERRRHERSAYSALGDALNAGYADLGALDAASEFESLRKSSEFRAVRRRLHTKLAGPIALSDAPILVWEIVWPKPVEPEQDEDDDGERDEAPAENEANARLPLVVMLHGTGENLSDAKLVFRPACRAHRAALLVIRGPETVPAQDEDAYRFGWGEHRTASIHRTTLAALAEHADRLDPERVIVAGHRQGGYYAARVALAYPAAYQAVFALSASLTDTAFGDAPLAVAAAAGMPVRVVNGTSDSLAFDAAKGAVAAWVARGVSAKFVAGDDAPDQRLGAQAHATKFLADVLGG